MTFQELMRHERLALAALARAMVRVDRSYSREESARLHAIAEELGDPEALWDAIEEAERTVTGPEQLRAITAGVGREGARDLILDTLASLAAAETMSRAEETLIAEVQATWARTEEPTTPD